MRVLVADDSAVNRELVERELRADGHEVVCVENGQDALNHLLQPFGPELAVLDWMMPGIAGPEVCRRVRERDDSSYRYLLILTMRANPEDAVEALDAGADDFLTKPFSPIELRARVRAGVRLLRSIGKLQSANAELSRLSRIDALTKVANRAAIVDRLNAECNRARREGRPVSIIRADIDQLAAIVRDGGETAGDAALIEVASALDDASRIYDGLGRYSEDEFLLVLPGAANESLDAVTTRVRSRISQIKAGPFGREISVCMATATWLPDGDATPQHVLRASARALSRAQQLAGSIAHVSNEDIAATQPADEVESAP